MFEKYCFIVITLFQAIIITLWIFALTSNRSPCSHLVSLHNIPKPQLEWFFLNVNQVTSLLWSKSSKDFLPKSFGEKGEVLIGLLTLGMIFTDILPLCPHLTLFQPASCCSLNKLSMLWASSSLSLEFISLMYLRDCLFLVLGLCPHFSQLKSSRTTVLTI